jgi:tetratricopeptide (TPR) repeat protein
MNRALPFLLAATSLQAGILISRSGQGLQFAEAAAVSINGKDKALSIGAQPRISPGKLPSVRLGGTLLRDADSRAIGVWEQGTMAFLVPDGLKNPSGDAGPFWQAAKIAYKKTEKDKVATDVPPASFVAFLPGGVEELTKICTDQAALDVLGGKGKSFAAQVELFAATVKSFNGNPAIAPLEKYLEAAMREPYEQFEGGTVGVDVLDRGLKYAALSAEVYPQVPEQQKLRDELKHQREWVDRKMAVLRAFDAGEEWDAFLLADRDFEKYQRAFPEMAAKQNQALKQSLQLHARAGNERFAENEFGAAFREFHVASMRQPTNSELQTKVFLAWSEYSRRVAVDHQAQRKQLSPGQVNEIEKDLLFATRYKDQNKLEDALKSVAQAELVDPDNLKVLLKKAEILGAMHEVSNALAVLDQYDLRAVDEERKPSNTMRSELLFQVTSNLKDLKVEMQKSWADSSYNRVHSLALQGLRAKDDDADLLYYAGMSSLVTRHPEDGRKFLSRYLDVSNTLDANTDQRVAVRRVISGIGAPARPTQGSPNWMSGAKLPENVYYCPISLAFQPKIDRIDASNKLKVTFEWDGDKLRSITPVFDKNEHVSEEKKISFAYEDKVPQVVAVAYENDAKAPAGGDPDEALKKASLVLLNSPYADPLAVAKLTGQNITLAVAGNRFFLPFVWDKIHYFRLAYDTGGRVSTAREVSGPRGALGDTLLEFHWDGLQLQSIEAYQISGEKRGAKFYERTMEYQSGRLMGETIESGGKSSRIKYTYNGGKLVSANCDKDMTLDGRSRQVMFR